jgi:hypothetical protein
VASPLRKSASAPGDPPLHSFTAQTPASASTSGAVNTQRSHDAGRGEDISRTGSAGGEPVQRRTSMRGSSATGRLAQGCDQIPTLRMKQRREGSGSAGGRQAPGKSNACIEAVWKGAPLAIVKNSHSKYGEREFRSDFRLILRRIILDRVYHVDSRRMFGRNEHNRSPSEAQVFIVFPCLEKGRSNSNSWR